MLAICCDANGAVLTPEHHMIEGERAFDRGDFEAAIVNWREAARTFVQTRQGVALRRVRLQLALAYEALGHYDRAMRTLQDIWPKAKRAGDQPQVAAILAAMGNIALAMGQWDQAERDFLRALRIGQHLDDPGLVAKMFNNLGNLFVTRPAPQANDFSRAVDFYRQSARTAWRVRHDAMAGRPLTHAAMALLKAYAVDRALLETPLVAKSWLDQAYAHLQWAEPSHAQVYDLINAGLAYSQLRT
ncbi:hypothetical protein C2W62_33355 [Candidatus Entotheonella serta]|nr:hypothetical protein C2W62_33355 [Candidatus Entotheonella serta]